MDENQVGGAIQQAAGKVQGAAGHPGRHQNPG